MPRIRCWSLLVVMLVAVSGAMSGAAHAQQYPVEYDFSVGTLAEIAHPGGSLPGANDWNCRPGAAHPNPVVLTHGTGGGKQTNWGVYVPLLVNNGYCVYADTFGNYDIPWPGSAIGGMLPIEQSAGQLAAFVDQVLAATGAARVDIVGHSQGNFIGNYYVKRLGGAAKVDKLVALAPPWLGTDAGLEEVREYLGLLGVREAYDAGIEALCRSCVQFSPNSDFVMALNADGVYHPDVAYTNIVTARDELVVPYTAGLVDGVGVTNIVVQDGCPTDYSEHAGLVGSPRAAAFALNALDPAHPRPVPCSYIAPFTGRPS